MVSPISRNRDKSRLRTGYTTGACAAAAARAAVRTLTMGKEQNSVTIRLPVGEMATFSVVRTEHMEDKVLCAVVKDAGDDPDCTHGAEICATARLLDSPAIEIEGGEGVARVTRPGLGLDVGGPAINPVPRRNITEMVQEELNEADVPGAQVIISVPTGRELARQTISERLGLVGGISILGTRGTVKPFSTSAYAASVRQSVQVATTNGIYDFVLTTGGRTEKYAMEQFPDFPPESFIQAGDFMGVGLRSVARYHGHRVLIVGMIGKIAKLADGAMMTHVTGPAVNFTMLAELAADHGASSKLCEEIRAANTARHVMELLQGEGVTEVFHTLCQRVVKQAKEYGRNAFPVDCYLIDFHGQLLGKHTETRKP